MTLAVGSRLGPYEILGQIGAGGMGEVYRARDTRLGREVAIKVLPAEFSADSERLSRFEQEARAASALNHPNILAIFDVGTHGETPYVVSELLEGETLRDRLAGARLPARKATDYATQMAEGLAAAQERGIVHRDLKPENLFVTQDGRIKILDFGLAKVTSPERSGVPLTEAPTRAAHTEPGVVMGTVGYMSPEQVRGQPADPRSDIFAFGAVLYEMLTGRRAFRGASPADTLSAILKEEPEFAAAPPEISPALEHIVRRCLEKSPPERFQSARDLAFALRESSSAFTASQSVSSPVPRSRLVLWLVLLGPVALLTALIAANAGGLRARLFGTKGQARIQSLAVLPLENLSRDPEQEYFVDGMTEAVIADLAKIKALRVISRTSVMPYKNTNKSMREIASELKADALIEGSVMRSADRVRITVQLIDASLDRHLWAESYERDLKNVFALQGEVAQAIAQQVRAAITPQERARLAKGRPVDPEVYELYLKGRHIMMRGGLEDVVKAIEYFQSGLAKDPNNALIYTGLADAYIQQMSDVHESPVDATAKSRAAAMKALELDESLAEAHTSLAMIKFAYDWDWKGAEFELKRAMELNPGYSLAYARYGTLLTAIGRHAEALAYFDKARRLDPLHSWAYQGAAYSDFMAGKYDDAIEQNQKGLEIEPDPMAYFSRVLAFAGKGDYASAISEAEKATKLTDSPLLMTSLASAYAVAGRRADSHRILQQLEEISKHQGPAPAWHSRRVTRYVCPYEVAGVYAQLGEKDRAFEWLDKAYQTRSCMYWLRQDPRLDSLHSDPRFQELLTKMKFPQ